MRILIVDDESLERMAIRKCLTDYAANNYQIEEAENGRIAIMKAETFRPDLIFMDIKMPGINGIEAAEEILNIHAQAKFVILSAYDTFEYARQTMKLGIQNYLLKPCSDEDVIEIIEKISNKIQIERMKRNEDILLRDQYQRALSLIEEKVIDDLLAGEKWERDEMTEGYLTKLEKPSRVIMIEWKETVDEQTIESFTAYTCSYLEQHFLAVYSGSCKKNVLPLLVQTEGRRLEVSFNELIKYYSEQYPHINIRLGIGKNYSEVSHFPHSYQEALFSLYANENTGNRVCLYEKIQQQKRRNSSYSYDLETKLIETITAGAKEEFISIYKRYIFMLTHHSEKRQAEMEKHVHEMLIVLKREIQKASPEVNFPEYSFYNLPLNTLEEEVKRVLFQLTAMINHLYEYQDRIEVAKKYIHTHYNEQLTLEDVSEVVQLSPHYFSKLFKTKIDQSFIEYVTEVRISKAKEQLQKPDANIKEICFNTGYKDPNYFSRVFKKMVGCTPSEYKESVMKEIKVNR